ncbi:MAG: LicD family protein [Clostridia bacterium]|nr:LicD family protein [Clostridia bacterium]
MRELILNDERTMCADIIKKQFKKLYNHGYAKKFKSVYFLGDENIIVDYLTYAIKLNNDKINLFENIFYSNFGDSNYQIDPGLDCVSTIDFDSLHGQGAYFFFANCAEKADGFMQKLELLQQLFEKADTENSKFVVTALMPTLPDFSVGAENFSEEEYDFYLRMCPRSPEIDYYIELERLCKFYARTKKINISILRFTNIFAPDGSDSPAFNIQSLVKEAYADRKIIITDEDYKRYYSLSYIRNACQCVFYALTKALKGQVYNADCSNVNIAGIKRMIYISNPKIFAFKADASKNITTYFHSISSGKFKKRGVNQPRLIENGIKHVVSYITGEEYDTTENVSFYEGKIKTIQALEVEILKEIDRICRKYDINYFLAGGTLLGAVRAGESIPWDDDLDIGMLRNDFEKFKKVVEKELDGKYSYSSPLNKSGSHYTIDKIRLDATYFSTDFSSNAVFPDGIFVDILVYDQTSNIKLFQKIHGFILTVLTHLIYIEWYNVARPKYHYKFSKIMLPIFRLIPWPVFHLTFEFFAKFYRNKKNSHWLVDTVGKKVNDGPLPFEGYDKMVLVDFEGDKFPIPEDAKPYLNYAYGPSYMQMPVLSKRNCPHNFTRIDLGKYVFNANETTPFRNVDIRGELYESDDEF